MGGNPAIPSQGSTLFVVHLSFAWVSGADSNDRIRRDFGFSGRLRAIGASDRRELVWLGNRGTGMDPFPHADEPSECRLGKVPGRSQSPRLRHTRARLSAAGTGLCQENNVWMP